MTNFTKGFFKQFSKKSEVVPSRKHYDSPVPLSFAQQRLWFLDQLLPNQPFYNAPLAFEVQGHLRVDVLIHSLTEICRRHEVLRTTFAPIEGRPLQVIHPPSRFCLLCIDMSQLTSQELEREAERVVNQEVVSPFDLARGPLLRAILLRLASDRHQFVFTMHHVVADRWARRVFIQELATLYTAYLRGESSPLEELPLQYADFALWQRQRLQGEVLERQLAYWREQLAGAPQVLELPMALPRPAVQTFRGATYPFTLSPALCADLRRVSRQEGVTLFMVLLATFQTLLLHYTGQPDLLVGTPIANRRYSELEGLIGFFANTLVLRTNLSGDPSFRDALKRVRDVCLGAYAHQDLPFEHLVEAMQAQRDMSYNPLIQVLFVFQNISDTSLKLEGLGVKPLSLQWQQAKFDLSLEIENTSPELVGVVEYSTDLFEVSSIHRFVQHFQRLLEGVIADPMRRLSDLPLLTQKERDQLLVDWNTTQRVYRQECCIQQLFEEQVVRTPEAVAVVFGELLLTYGILNEYANQLAHHLRRQGVAPEVLVGIYMERSLGMIVGLLGILKAGGAYLPLDPASPQERLAFMLQNAQVEIVVTQQRYVMEMSEREIQLVVLDSDWRKIAQESDENPGCDAIPENLAYVIYTSGSTGRSKGVMVTHASLANAYWGWEEAYQLRALLRCHLQMANFSFDVFTGDVVRALCSGAKLVFCTQEILLSPDKLYALMLREMVDVGEFVPVVLGNLVQYLQVSQQSLEYMKLLVVGSDSWYGRDQEALQSVCPPGTRLVNSYGITETTIDSTYFEGVEQVQFADRLVPIGRPFANIQVYVLNEVLRPTPIGVVGELYIGGAGLARGYFNHPMLTAERFLPHSLSSKPGARIYKTGDLARYREDGTIEFLGRKDKQIKLRGYRIELGEIEAILEQYPLVREAIVLLREEAPGERQLVAYLLPRGEEQPDNKELRMHLQRFLPHYMLPNAFVLLHAWPLTASGKVDRLRLPAPNLSHRVVPEMLVAPRTPIEELLVEIWQQVLRIERVGIFDNFFDLGGHSLLATQVISRICSAFQMDFPLRALFEAPTIIGLAQRLEQSLNIPQQVPALPLHSYARPNELPLSFAQQRLWFLDQLLPNQPFYNAPLAFEVRGPLQVAALTHSLTEILRRHEVLRTTFAISEGRPLQVIHPPSRFCLVCIDMRQLTEEKREREAERVVNQEVVSPFDLARGPLLRGILLWLAPERYQFVLTMHHIVADHWTESVFIQELTTLYAAALAEVPSSLEELPLQYADFALWQRQWLQGEVLERQLVYWREQLAEAPQVLELPMALPRPAVQTFRGASYPFTFSPALGTDLRRVSRQEGVTLFMVLLAAFQTLLRHYTGQSDLVVGTPIANRSYSELEGLIGFFANTLVLRTKLSRDPSFREVLKQVRDVCLGAYAHQDLPFEYLVEVMQVQRDMSRTPLVQVVFSFHNELGVSLELKGLTVKPLSFDQHQAKFDLTMIMFEKAQELHGAVEYSTDLFEVSSIARFVQDFQHLLENLVANPLDTALSEFLLPREREHIAHLLIEDSSEMFKF